jgi:hypothetical protein
MKNVLLVVSAVLVVVALVVGGFLVSYKHTKKHGCCVDKTCTTNCDCPCTKANNVLRWVKDPNLGTLYYGWYEADGSAFNYIATASRNNRMGYVPETNVPAHKWVQVN